MSLVRDFHRAFDLEAYDYPKIPDTALSRFRLRLIAEEYKEVRAELEALASKAMTVDEKLDTMRRLLKELCDLRYVIEGTAVSLGLPFESAYLAVHRSNMSKLGPDGPITRDDGKVLKGPNFHEPNLRNLVPDVIDLEEAVDGA